MLVYLNLVEDEQWTKVKTKKDYKVQKILSAKATLEPQSMGQVIARLKRKRSQKKKSKVVNIEGDDELLQEKRVPVTLKEFIPA